MGESPSYLLAPHIINGYGVSKSFENDQWREVEFKSPCSERLFCLLEKLAGIFCNDQDSSDRDCEAQVLYDKDDGNSSTGAHCHF